MPGHLSSILTQRAPADRQPEGPGVFAPIPSQKTSAERFHLSLTCSKQLDLGCAAWPGPFHVLSETGQRCRPLILLVHSGFVDTVKT